MRNRSFWLHNLYILLGLTIVAKCMGVGMLFFLPTTSLEKQEFFSGGLVYRNYQMAKAFGYLVQSKQPFIENLAQLPDAKELLLQAIYRSDQGSYVIVRHVEHKEVGIVGLNELFYGYKVIEVAPKQIVLLKDAHQFLLRLDDNEKLESTTLGQEQSPSSSSQPKSIRKEDVTKYAKDFDAIWKNIKITPLKEKDKLLGYKVNYVKKNSVFGALGLEKNDLIIKVNGEVLGSDAQAFAIYKKITSYDYFVITVLRNGQERDLHYEIR